MKTPFQKTRVSEFSIARRYSAKHPVRFFWIAERDTDKGR
jgi:hypothetical protein